MFQQSTVILFCEMLNDPVNGVVTFPSNLEGSMATYTCNNGYELVGEGSRMCERNPSTLFGVWSGIEPTCTGIFAYVYVCC